MIAFDDRDRPSRLEQSFQRSERLGRPREVLQDEANEDVIERFVLERRGEDVGAPELHVGQLRCSYLGTRFLERSSGNVNRHDSRAEAVPGKSDRLRTDSASHFEHAAASRVGDVGVKQIDERSSLII